MTKVSNEIESQILNKNGIDWDKDDIHYALRKRGLNLCELSRKAGLSDRTLNNSLYRKWPKGDQVIADALGIDPAQIWPSRYSR
ncbi:transcriptional regulator [Erwinia psidii]|uniref:helix-turn-helix domain-containing protein n=1 Tax=Erwinia psidii TaxID=69224 RepID=UPI002B4744CC|nr:helix-turn-helix transcriptional regulator [Erwinia psidii]MCX8962170.1 transcriptional regulator [Erwinia psidii]